MYAKLRKDVKTQKDRESVGGMIVERNIKEVWDMKNRWASGIWFSWAEEIWTQVLALQAAIQSQNDS